MKINIENLGPIQSGEIEINKDFTLILGSNHAGLSLVSNLIYGCQAITQYSPHSKNLNNAYKEALYEAFNKVDPLVDYLQDNLLEVDIPNFLEWNARLIFRVRENIFQRFSPTFFASSDIKPRVRIRYALSSQIFTRHIQSGDLKLGDNQYEVMIDEQSLRMKAKAASNFVVEEVKEYVYRNIHDLQAQCVFHFPIERIALHTFVKELCTFAERDPESLSHYSLSLRDYLALANNPSTRFQSPDNGQPVYEAIPEELAEALDKKVLRGEVLHDPELGICYNLSDDLGDQEIRSAPALFKSLSGLSLYLKGQARVQDILILEEPEQNLHPESQVLLARYLARLANHGLKIVLYTHSDFISRELSNLIVLGQNSNVSPRLRKKYAYRVDELLEPTQVTVYSIKDQSLESVSITEQGIETDEIDGITTDLNQRSDDIFYSSVDNQ